MSTQTLYNLFVLVAALLSLSAAVYAIRRDHRLANRAFVLLMLAISEWSFCYLFSAYTTDLLLRAFWMTGAFVGIAFVGPLWLLFTLANTGQIERLPPYGSKAIILLGGVSFIATLGNVIQAVVTLGLAETVARDGTLHGPFFWTHTLIAYSTLLAGIVACVRALAIRSNLYRGQALLMLVGALLPLLVNIAHLASIFPLPPSIDPTPIGLIATILAFGIAVHRHQMLRITPIAHKVVFESMPEGMVVLDNAGLILEHNAAARKIAALKPNVDGKSLEEASNDKTLVAVLRAMASEQTHGEQVVEYDFEEPRRIAVQRTQLLGPSGRSRGTLFMLRDITMQTRAARALERQAADLTSVHHVASAVGATLDPHELLRVIVTTTRDALGMTQASVGVLDLQRSELRITAESDAPDGMSVVGTIISLQDGFGHQWETGAPLVFEDVLQDARLLKLHDILAQRNSRALMVVPLRNNDQLIGTLNLASATPRRFDPQELALAQQIAGYEAAAMANAQLFDETQQAVRAKSAILDTVSHEFRTPITSILGFTELYQEQMLGPVTDEQREALDAVHRNANRLLRLVDDLLDLARLEAGKLDMSFYPIEVTLCIQEAAAFVASQYEQKHLPLQIDVVSPLPFALGDAMWLRRVLVNLLNNAIRFTDSGGVTIRAYADPLLAEGTQPTVVSKTTAMNRRAVRVMIEVEDTGYGIPELELQTIFEAFRRAEDTLNPIPTGSGSGLGLAISKRAINQMGGDLTVRSRAGHGSVFTIALRPAELALEYSNT